MMKSKLLTMFLGVLAMIFLVVGRSRAAAIPAAPSPGEVLLVYNANSPISTAVAKYYQRKRAVTNVVAVKCVDSAIKTANESIFLANFKAQIADPVRAYLANHSGINFIVLTKGIPIRICGTDVRRIKNGSYTFYRNINLRGARSFSARFANPSSPGTIQIRLDNPKGKLIGTCPVSTTGGFQKWTTSTCRLAKTTGTHTLYLVYSGGFNIEWFTFTGNIGYIQAASYNGSSQAVRWELSSEGGSTLTGSQPQNQTYINYTPSVDSYLAAIDYPDIKGAVKASLTGSGATGVAWVNRYYDATVPFTHAQFGGYLVTRLDGYTQANATALVDNALTAEHHHEKGTILFDVEPDFGMGNKAQEPLAVPLLKVISEARWDTWNADMLHAGDILTAAGIPCDVAVTKIFAGKNLHLLGYFSWGDNDDHFNANVYKNLTFVPGAIGDTAVSTGARTFLPTSGGQSLIVDLIARGITGVQGYVDEPLLDAISSPTIDLTRYLSGYTLAESFYAGTKYIGWEGIVVGDPLCCPYAGRKAKLLPPTAPPTK